MSIVFANRRHRSSRRNSRNTPTTSSDTSTLHTTRGGVMARGEHHKIHAQDRTQRHRVLVAQEAARLMSEHGIRDFHHAKLKAAERLGIADAQALPRNYEIEDALREHQRIFHADTQPQALRARREAAVEGMFFLRGFDPR